MSVITQNISVTYISTGTVGPYAFNFSLSTSAALKVIVNNTVLSPTAYIVTPVNNNPNNGGSVLLLSPAPAGQSVVLQRSTPLTQASVYTDNMPPPMVQFESALDKLTEIVQELAANQGSAGGATLVTAGTGIIVTGTGTVSDPYIISTASAFSIVSFTGGQSGELGQSFVNPSFGASYTGTPISANITNTDGLNSPHALSTPFTAGSLSATFVHTATATTTFTLTASNGVISPTATVTFTWAERIFGGVGAVGATSSVTASGNNAILSNAASLASAGLGVEVVGQTFGPFNPSGQGVYLLLSGGSHTFTDAISGFPFAFNAPIAVTFVNQFGVTLSMFLYQSVNPLTGTFQPRVAS